MEQVTPRKEQSAQKAPRSFDKERNPPVEITRSFRAPAEKLWNAMSKPELLQQWWGPEGYSCPEAKVDFRVDGKYLAAMKGPDQKVIWSGGTYLELVPLIRIVCTDMFTDDKGNPVDAKNYGMPGSWPESLLVTFQFDHVNAEQTTLRLKHEGIPKEMHDDCVKGWNSSFDKLERLVQTN